MCCIFCVITTILHTLTRSRIRKAKKPVNEVFCQIFHLLTHDPPWIIRPMAICEAIIDCSSWVPTRAQSGSGQGYRKANSCAQFHFHQGTHTTWWWRCSLALSSPSRKHLQPQQRMVTRVDKKNFISISETSEIAIFNHEICSHYAKCHPTPLCPRQSPYNSIGLTNCELWRRSRRRLQTRMRLLPGISVNLDSSLLHGRISCPQRGRASSRWNSFCQHVLPYAAVVGDASC